MTTTYTYTSDDGFSVKVIGEQGAWEWKAFRKGDLIGGGGLYKAKSTARDAAWRWIDKNRQ